MEQEFLRGLFCKKIELEYQVFRRTMLGKGREMVFARAEIIQEMTELYHNLIEMESSMTKEEMESLMIIPEVLQYLRREWHKKKKNGIESGTTFLRQKIMELEKIYQEVEKEGQKAV